MLVQHLAELKTLVNKSQCLLGLDYGSKVIGVAVCDPAWRVASPLATLERKKFAEDAAFLFSLVKERNIGGLVVGLPKNMDGSEGSSAQAVRTFVRNLLHYKVSINDLPPLSPDFPVLFWDERLSTAAVERMLIESDMSRKRRDAVVDKSAAAYILQGALDAFNAKNGGAPY